MARPSDNNTIVEASSEVVPYDRLIKPVGIMDHINSVGVPDHGLAEDDIPKAVARWSKGNAADQSIAAAYKALEEGRQMVQLTEVIAKGGSKGYFPGLALVRADRSEVRCVATSHGDVTYRAKRWSMTMPDLLKGWTRVYRDDAPGSRRATALAPHIPPEVRENRKLKDHLLLWEPSWRVEADRPLRRPFDPALLEQVVGDLYCVVAAWDLSPLEMAALGG